MADNTNSDTPRAPYPGATPVENVPSARQDNDSDVFFPDFGGDGNSRTHPSSAHTYISAPPGMGHQSPQNTHTPATSGMGHQSQTTRTPATQGAGQQGQHNYQRAMPAPGQQGYYQQVPPVRTEQYGAGLGHSTQAPPMMRPGQFGPMPSPGQVIEHMARPPGEQKPAFVFGPRAADPDAPPAPKTASKTVKRKVETRPGYPGWKFGRKRSSESLISSKSPTDRTDPTPTTSPAVEQLLPYYPPTMRARMACPNPYAESRQEAGLCPSYGVPSGPLKDQSHGVGEPDLALTTPAAVPHRGIDDTRRLTLPGVPESE